MIHLTSGCQTIIITITINFINELEKLLDQMSRTFDLVTQWTCLSGLVKICGRVREICLREGFL